MDVDNFNPKGTDSIIKHFVKLYINSFITAIFLVFAIILLLTNSLVLFAVFTLVPWVWINISRFNLSISKKYYFSIILRIMFVEGFILAFAFWNSSISLIGLEVNMFYIALISLIGACIWLAQSISKDKTIIKLLITTEMKNPNKLKQNLDHSYIKCENCGEFNVEYAQYCQNCGNKLSESLSKDTTKKRTPKYIKNILWAGWLAFFLLFINFFSPKIYMYFVHRTLNGTWGEINLIILILGILVAVYFYTQVHKIKDEISRNPDGYYNRMITIIAFVILLALITRATSF